MADTVNGFKVGNETKQYDYNSLANLPKGSLTLNIGGTEYTYNGKNTLYLYLNAAATTSMVSADDTEY